MARRCAACAASNADALRAVCEAVAAAVEAAEAAAAADAETDGPLVLDVTYSDGRVEVPADCRALALVNLARDRPAADLGELVQACPGLEYLVMVRVVPTGSFDDMPTLRALAYMDPHPPRRARPALKTLRSVDRLALDNPRHESLVPNCGADVVYVPGRPGCARDADAPPTPSKRRRVARHDLYTLLLAHQM